MVTIRLQAVASVIALVVVATPHPFIDPSQVAMVSAERRPASSCSGTWSIDPTPGIGSSALYSASAVSSSDAWAVGGVGPAALAEHWNGSSWAIVPTPDLDTSFSQFTAVSALSGTDAWAVGDWYPPETLERTALIEHWDGAAWTVAPGPTGSSDLLGIAALSPTDVWAVGWSAKEGGGTTTLAEHWDGVAWGAVTTPQLGNHFSQLLAVAVISSDDAWAVGNYDAGSVTLSVIEHWDGSAWNIVGSPSPHWAYLVSVAAVSSSDVWAVGSRTRQGGLSRAYALHWDGNTWSEVITPRLGVKVAGLRGASAVSSSEVWAVGYYRSKNQNHTLIEQWNGSQWQLVSSPNSGSSDLEAVSADSSMDAIAVGIEDGLTLVERYCQT